MVRVIVNHLTKSREDAERLMGVIVQLRNEAMKQPGYVTGETLVNNEDPTNILVISTWNTPESWDAWDTSEARTRITREMMMPLLREPYTVNIHSFARMQRGRVMSIV